MLENLAYMGWWFRELLALCLWWVFVGRDEMARKLDNRHKPLLGLTRREESDERNTQ